MEERRYHLRMTSTHVGPANDVATLRLELLVDEAWTAIELDDPGMSPFKIFMFSTLLCQNSYLYMNARERAIEIDTTRGHALIRTAEFELQEIVAEFETTLRTGEPSEEDVSFTCGRMLECPVSRNLQSVRKKTTLRLGAHQAVVESPKPTPHS